MNNESTITERGQITLPKGLRERLGLKPGTVVSFTPSAQGLLIRKTASETNPMREVFGVLKDRTRTNDYLHKIRGKVE